MTGTALTSHDPRLEGKRSTTTASLWAAQQEGLDNKNTFPGSVQLRPCPWSQKVLTPPYSRGLPFKVLLILDNVSGHPKHHEFNAKSIKVVCLSPNTAPLIQPPGQQIRRAVQAHYTLHSMERLVNSTHENPIMRILWKSGRVSYIIEDAIVLIKAVKAIKPKTVNSCWRKLYPDAVHDFTGFTTEPIKEIMKDCGYGKDGGSGGWWGGNG